MGPGESREDLEKDCRLMHWPIHKLTTVRVLEDSRKMIQMDTQ